MSKGFGVDVYGVPYYGPETAPNTSVAPSVAPFTATQADYGEIVLAWAAPQNTPWKYMQLVRSTYGYPSTAQDGILLAQFTNGTMQKSYDDAGLTPGVIYYYTMFVTLEAPTWSSSVTYPLNYQVLYNGLYWNSLSASNTNHTPGAGSTFWAPTQYVPTWLPAGYAGTLALANDGYGTLLYNRAPQPYKINSSDIYPDAITANQSFQNYLNVMGFGLDQTKNFYDSLLQVNNPDTVSATSLDILGQQLGITTDYMTTPQMRRQRIKNASINYRMKGEPQSIHNVIAQLTGWDSSITEASNMFTSGDQSAATHPSYDVWNVNTTYFPNQLVQYNGYNYKNLVQSVGTAQAPTGANSSNTWWSVQTSVVDTSISHNPMTNLYYTWGPGTNTTMGGVYTGLPHPTNTAINNWNAFSFTYTGNTLYEVHSAAPWYTPNYSASTNYVINNFVLYTDGYYYRALKPSGPGTPYGAITPGTNSSFWKAFYFKTTDFPNYILDGAPIASMPTWNTVTNYTVGQQVQYQGIIYQCATANINQQPSGYYYSNKYWLFVQPSDLTLVSSGYFTMVGASGTSNFITPGVQFFDTTGTLIKNYSSHYSNYNVGNGFTARFVADHTDLNGTTEVGLVNAVGGELNTSTWTSTPNTATLWRTSYGMASANQTIAGTTTYVYSLLTGLFPNGRFALTFASDFVDTAHKTHGLMFAVVDANNFWYATRQSLWKVVAGVETKMLSWTRLNTGDRIVVDWSATAIDCYVYARDGKGTLNLLGSVTTGIPTTGNNLGIIQKYSASGAL